MSTILPIKLKITLHWKSRETPHAASTQRKVVASYSMKTNTHSKNHHLPMRYEVTISITEKNCAQTGMTTCLFNSSFFSFCLRLSQIKIHTKCNHCMQARLATSFNTMCHIMLLCKAFEVCNVITLPVQSLRWTRWCFSLTLLQDITNIAAASPAL